MLYNIFLFETGNKTFLESLHFFFVALAMFQDI